MSDQLPQKQLRVKRITLDDWGHIREIEFHNEASLTAVEIREFVIDYNTHRSEPTIPEKPTKIGNLDEETKTRLGL